MRAAATICLSLFAASPATAYYVLAESIGAGGFADSNSLGTVEIGNVLTDASGNRIDGYAQTSGESGGMSGHMLVEITD